MEWHVDTLSFLGPRHTERHLRLTEAAISAFAEKGLAETSISDISERAGVARTQFYFAWEDRSDCFTFCHHLCLAEVERRIERSLDDVDSWHERLLAGIGAMVQIVDEDPEIARIALQDGPASRRDVDIEARRKSEGRLIEALLNLYKEAAPDEFEPDPQVARMAIGAAQAVLTARIDAPEEAGESLANDLTVALLSFGFGPTRVRSMTASSA